ncbi:homospermidine synthase [Stella humosa]|uniref:Homospermidine synthase n=2 Tax=cellular organisms TaxID=131567 RepID=A0A3N1ME94_9PROT|nr:saccharopine dehydrogenase C-terminal domain-containing protein [Stella humosa]ROQ01878.1 homospermidine synthase [Stella humosa]BBK32267.1 homospermidine synthase [Stella humosa]
MKHVRFPGKIVMVGMGSIGQGVLPLIFRHIAVDPQQITIVTADDRGRAVAGEYGVQFIEQPLTRDNYAGILTPMLAAGDFLVNLSVEVSSVALMELCQAQGALYLDTCIEPWPGGYTDPSLTYSQRSNYGLRETALALKAKSAGGPTAVITHGANPGIVSHFVKRALLDIARDTGKPVAAPKDRAGWSGLAEMLGVKTIHIAERDTQVSLTPKRPGEFVNTWSIDGFVSEGCQPAELGWGTHERHFPADGARHETGSNAAIYLMRPGASTRVRTWTPLAGPIHGFLITHNESISIADYYTVAGADGSPRYRPTVHYAYHPCDDAVLSVHELAGRNWQQQTRQRLMVDEVVSGIDELGVLLMGHAKGAYWFGSRLTIDETRHLVPHNNATSLQVTVGVLAGMIWAMENPKAGIVEPDELDHERMFAIMTPYLGNVVGQYGGWTPLEDRSVLFPEDIDRDCPWQFKNFRVV